jgi:hypothetical protein
VKPGLLRILLAAQLFIACAAAAPQPDALPVSQVEIDTLAKRVAGAGDSVTRTQRLVTWMSSRLEWVATDYEERTPEQILARGAGNCADLASVLERLLRPAGIPYRWVEEINVQPVSAERQSDADALIRQRGAGLSVFGRQHNDHRWLEIEDNRTHEWVPADPATGLVGTSMWERGRLAFGNRPPPAVPAVADLVKDMIVPISVTTSRDAAGARIDRSAHYLIDEFDHLYQGKVHTLPSWPKWASAVREFSPLAQRAFDGKVNLHEHTARIETLAATYESLRREADRAGLVAAN